MQQALGCGRELAVGRDDNSIRAVEDDAEAGGLIGAAFGERDAMSARSAVVILGAADGHLVISLVCSWFGLHKLHLHLSCGRIEQ